MGFFPDYSFCDGCRSKNITITVNHNIDVVLRSDKYVCEDCSRVWYHEFWLRCTRYAPNQDFEGIVICESYDPDYYEKKIGEWQEIQKKLADLEMKLSRATDAFPQPSRYFEIPHKMENFTGLFADLDKSNVTIYVDGKKQDPDNWFYEKSSVAPRREYVIDEGAKITVDVKRSKQ